MSDAPRPILAVSASGRHYSCTLRPPQGADLSDPGTDGLLPAVDRLFQQIEVPRTELGEVRLDLGPGSYTGLRVAVTFARTALAFGSATVRTATSLELLALAALDQQLVSEGQRIRLVLDARRNRLHHATIRIGSEVERITKPTAEPIDEVVRGLGDDEVILAEANLLDTLRPHAKGDVVTIPDGMKSDLSRWLLDPRIRLQEAATGDLEPLYLMGTYAD